MRKCTVLWLHEYIQPSNLSSALMLPSAFGLHFLSRLKGLSSSKAEQHTYFEITFVDFTNVFTHSSDTLYLNIVKCHTSFSIPISKMTSFICKKKTFILRPFLANFDAKVTRIFRKGWWINVKIRQKVENIWIFPPILNDMLLRRIKQPLKNL